MAKTTCKGVTFTGQLTVTVGVSGVAGGVQNLVSAAPGGNQPGNALCYKRSRDAGGGWPKHETLWLISPEMQFSATITAVAPNPTDIANWEVGILQTITRCERTALYSNHIARRVRLDTSFGGLKDGSNGELYYVGSSDFQAAATPNTYTAQVYESDSPNFEAPLTYSGNAATPFAGWPQQLAATEGRDEFVTFLAAVDSSTHSIVTLGRCVWVVDWRGSFDRKTKTWTPRDVADILDYNLVNLGSAYEDLTNQDYGKVPMSLFLSEAEEAFQIYDGAAWQGCSPRGMIDGRHLTLTRWV